MAQNMYTIHSVTYVLCKAISPLCKSMTEVMFWFIMYVNESIESTHCERVRFQGQISWRFSLSKNYISPAVPDLELILFPLW